MKQIALALSLILVALSAEARLGENETQFSTRYNNGKIPTQTPSDKFQPIIHIPSSKTQTYTYQGWVIRAGFINGVCHRIQYRRDHSARLSDEDVKAVLGANGGVNSWRPAKSDQGINPIAAMQSMLEDLGGGKPFTRVDGSRARVQSHQIIILESGALLASEEAAKKPVVKPPPQF